MLLWKKKSKKLDCFFEILYPFQNWFTTSMWILILAFSTTTLIVFTTIVNSLPTEDENCQCGKSLRTRNLARIWGGKTISIQKYPWHIAIFEYVQGYQPQDFTLDYLCGGSLISPQKVLTAYHCIYGKHICTMFENHRKSLIQNGERSELPLHFEWGKVD